MVDPGLAAPVDDPAVSAVGEGHSLGRAARARGVEDHRHLVGVGPDGRAGAAGREPADVVEVHPPEPGGKIVRVFVAEGEPGARVPQHVPDGRGGGGGC